MKNRRALVASLLVTALAFTPAAGIAAECEGDECQVLPPPPEEVAPATAGVYGPGNPPVRFPKEREPHKRKHRKHKKERSHDGGRRGGGKE